MLLPVKNHALDENSKYFSFTGLKRSSQTKPEKLFSSWLPLYLLLCSPHTHRRNRNSTQAFILLLPEDLRWCTVINTAKDWRHSSGKNSLASFFFLLFLKFLGSLPSHKPNLSFCSIEFVGNWVWVNKETKENALAMFAVGIEMSFLFSGLYI